MNWLDKQVSLYTSHLDNLGRPATFREILFSAFGSNINEICALRQLDINDPAYKKKATLLKSKLQGYTPSALLRVRKNESSAVIERTGIIQFDFDFDSIRDYGIEELKQAVFNLPFIAFCGLSCSGKGLYALASIGEPEKQSEYATHCFEVFESCGIPLDQTKGRNVNDFRYISYDANFLIREKLEALKISCFRRKEVNKTNFEHNPPQINLNSNNALVKKFVDEISVVQDGHRFEIVRKSAFTLGGTGKYELLEEIKAAIINNNSFAGQQNKFLEIAEKCFKAGLEKPLKI